MANFGFADMRVVNPYHVAFREARSAVGAAPLLASAREFPSVADAVGKYGRTEAGRQLQSAVVGARCALGFGGVGLILGRCRPKQK